MSLRPPPRHAQPARRFADMTRDGVLRLPVCRECGTVAYPLREACGHCLADALDWRAVEAAGTLLADTTLHHSNEPFFRPRLPIRVGSVRLDAGVTVIAFLADDRLQPADRVVLAVERDAADQAVLVARALPAGG